jgi:hypothetical protein
VGHQVPTRLAVWLVVALVGIAFLVGIFHWQSKPYSCFNGRHFYGDWTTVYSFGGKFEVRVKSYGCAESDRYDPKVFHKL